MTTTSTLIENISAEDLTKAFRSIIQEELSRLNPQEATSRYLSRQEVADLLKISLPTLNEYTRAGIIKGSRVGSRVLYEESAIKDAVKEIPALKYRRA
jgi:excisionase family DNA binding protein